MVICSDHVFGVAAKALPHAEDRQGVIKSVS